jgi:hypothetical protein
MTIKNQWKGKTLVSYDPILGERRIEVDKIQPKDEAFIKRLGYGYIFEDETEIKPIEYKAVEQPIKRTRKKRTQNGKA